MKKIGRRAGILILAAIGIVAVCVLALRAFETRGLGERHRPTNMPMRLWINAAGQPLAFPDYLVAAKAAIGKYRWVIPGETPEERRSRVEVISPREWPRRTGCDSRNSDGVLLIHGLTDSPFLMRELGDFFSRLPRCLLVRSILLPGHASAPGDMLRMDYEEWIEAARYGIESFRGEVAAVHVAGFSTGGALALYWAHNAAGLGVPIRSLILFSPAIRPTGKLVRLNVLPHVAFALSRATDLRVWPDKHADQDYAKYESFALNAGYQIYLLDQRLKKSIGKRLDVPVFAALSRDDETVNSDDTIRMFLDSTSPASRMMLVARDKPGKADELLALAAADKSRVWLPPASMDDKRPGRPAAGLEKVIDFAHTSFVASPDNPHYGRKGDYAECLAYADGGDPRKYCKCVTPQMTAPECAVRTSEEWVYGERHEASIEKYVLRRLTFNPYFAEMTHRIEEFMASIDAGKGSR